MPAPRKVNGHSSGLFSGASLNLTRLLQEAVAGYPFKLSGCQEVQVSGVPLSHSHVASERCSDANMPDP